ncbi:MAG: bifunctional phosphoribosylaminoimidazolecarboxamide formyltransferase/IMP cyclohydrolase [Burkholderiales bacterium 28-67-8]|nr:MAG: bifunctional phosphoribosylaminoimidazolecarboxamide formyltransferase/IMP cyclohydrolase [Burkholderiales bacterium 28-67-8]
MHALISVSDKTGVLEFARGLAALGVKLLSTGGTAKLLAEGGLAVTEVADHTGFPEMLDGRVKTLHPKIHGGLLARRDLPEHRAALTEHGIDTIDLLVVNLYPFEATVAKAGCTLEETDAAQYAGVLAELQAHGAVQRCTRFALAVAAFNRISNYDAAISDHLSSLTLAVEGEPKRSEYPAQSNGRFVKLQDLRYGENPHQSAAFYRDLNPAPGSLVTAVQLQGKELSYNNIADADAAWECVKSFGPADAAAACVIVKHANPCGVALAANAAEAYSQAFKTDPTSAFGGIIAFNVEVDAEAARRVAAQFLEVLIAPSYTAEALAVLAPKTATRVLRIPLDGVDRAGATAWSRGRNQQDIKRVGSGLLIQGADDHEVLRSELKVVTRLQPTEAQWVDLLFAWKVAKYVKSNAIVFCGGAMTLGVGAGQMSRIDSARIASIKAANAGLTLAGSAVASDAFFPFRDGLDVVCDAGATSVIHPGGSVRDGEVIAAADERGIAMVLTGVRHFRH